MRSHERKIQSADASAGRVLVVDDHAAARAPA